MFIVESYPLAVVLCCVTMFCWGSWANTQKLAGDKWRFELYYWDYVFGVLILTTISAFTVGSFGSAGRPFLEDASQAYFEYVGLAFLGGAVFNAANILLVAAIAIAGMSVAFPVGIGLALVLGVLINYVAKQQGNPVLLAVGVGLITAAIILDAIAYKSLPGGKSKGGWKGLVLSVVAGILMSLFYFLVAHGMAKDFQTPADGYMGPYTAVYFFAFGIFVSNLLFNRVLMAKPFVGEPVTFADYKKGTAWQHLLGIFGGIVWAIGMTLSIIASGTAGTAISYGLGQGATMVAAIWGVFVWREFREAPKSTWPLIWLMFVGYFVGLGVIVWAGM